MTTTPDRSADQHHGMHYAGCCEVCATEAYAGSRSGDSGLKTWECPTCGRWGCPVCRDVLMAAVCEGCRKQFCSGCIEVVDGLWFCAECKAQHLAQIAGEETTCH